VVVLLLLAFAVGSVDVCLVLDNGLRVAQVKLGFLFLAGLIIKLLLGVFQGLLILVSLGLGGVIS